MGEGGPATGRRGAVGVPARDPARGRGRPILTRVAAALATAMLTALVAIADTGRTRVLDQITNGGALAGISVSAAAPNPSEEGLDNPTPGPSRVLTAASLSAMKNIRDVTAVVPILQAGVIVIPPAGIPAGSSLCQPGGGCGTARGTSADPPTYGT